MLFWIHGPRWKRCFRSYYPYEAEHNDDGSYEYKFRVRSVDGDKVINVFEGDYEVKIFQTIKKITQIKPKLWFEYIDLYR